MAGDELDQEDGGEQLTGDAAALADAGQGDAQAQREDAASELQDGGADASKADASNPTAVRFQRVWDEVLEPATCIGCHPVVASDRALDLSSIETAYRSLVDPAPKCIGKPYVKAGVPADSLLLDVIAIPIPSCNITRMPQGMKLSSAQVALLRQWVADGALR